MPGLRTYSLGKARPYYPNFNKPEDLAAQTYEIQGKGASLNEYNVALGLESMGYEYEFQVDLFGGRRELGGAVLDFLVVTVPLPTPLLVQGDYWHSGIDHEKDLLLMARIESELGGEMNPPVELWSYQTATPEIALFWLRRYL